MGSNRITECSGVTKMIYKGRTYHVTVRYGEEMQNSEGFGVIAENVAEASFIVKDWWIENREGYHEMEIISVTRTGDILVKE